MKLKSHIIWTLGFIIVLPVTFLVLLYFGGMFDAHKQDYAIKKTVSAIYDSCEKENWENFKLDPYLEDSYKIKVVITNAEGLILFSSLPEIKAGQNVSAELWTRLMQYSSDQMLSFWTLSKLENNFDFVLKNLKGYKKYDLHAGIIMRVSPMMKLHPFMRWVLIILQFALMFIALAAIALFITGIVRIMNAVNLITKDYAEGNYGRDLPPSKSEEGNTLISVFNKMSGKIRKNEKQRIHLIMGLSHDFKTPLTLIKGYSELIGKEVEKNLPDESKNQIITKSLSVINSKTEQLETMVEDLTDFASLENGDFPVNLEKVNFGDWIISYVHQTENDAKLAGKTLECQILTTFDIEVQMDKRLIERVLDNLVHNAIRYTGADGKILITAGKNKDGLTEFSVIDNGPGIAEKDMPYIFDMFYRGSPSRSDGGSGLGLSVVKDIIQAHGWQIEASNIEPHGAKFTIRIPKAKSK